jgi:tetratricopeptide (TPR) repeat protein
LAPNDLDILLEASSFAGNLGRIDQAIMLDKYAVLHDPINPRGHLALGFDHYYAGHYDQAISSFNTGLALSPGRLAANYFLGTSLLLQGDAEAALAAMERESPGWRRIGLPLAYHALGRNTEADAALVELIRTDERDSSYNIAYVLAYCNEADRAFEWLHKAVTYHAPGLTEILVQPLFANIRNDARWLPFLSRIGRAPEQLAAIKFEVKLPQQ